MKFLVEVGGHVLYLFPSSVDYLFILNIKYVKEPSIL
jgi:hypothetical protein